MRKLSEKQKNLTKPNNLLFCFPHCKGKHIFLITLHLCQKNMLYNTHLTFQAANEIFSTSIDIIKSMVEQVYALDAAIIEFQKVSDLSGQALDNYISKLSTMGEAVARTGKPKCQAPDDGIVNQHQEPLEIQYNLRAYSTTMIA